jgi:hypothetical protein
LSARLGYRALVGVTRDHRGLYEDLAARLEQRMHRAARTIPWTERERLGNVATAADAAIKRLVLVV